MLDATNHFKSPPIHPADTVPVHDDDDLDADDDDDDEIDEEWDRTWTVPSNLRVHTRQDVFPIVSRLDLERRGLEEGSGRGFDLVTSTWTISGMQPNKHFVKVRTVHRLLSRTEPEIGQSS